MDPRDYSLKSLMKLPFIVQLDLRPLRPARLLGFLQRKRDGQKIA
jgi:hypothetical protein